MTGVCGCGNHPPPRFSGMHGPLSSVPPGSLWVSQCSTCHNILDLQTQGQQVPVIGPLFTKMFTVFHSKALSAYLRDTLAASMLSSWGPETCCSVFPLVVQLRAGDEELVGFQADVFLIASLLVGKRHVSLEEMTQTTLEAFPHPLWWLRSELMMTECCWGCGETPDSCRWQRTPAKLLWPCS